MPTLVTGGTGFIGAELVRQLLARGEREIVVFDISADLGRLRDLAGELTFVRGDLGNMSHVLDAVRRVRPEVIFHLGGHALAAVRSRPRALENWLTSCVPVSPVPVSTSSPTQTCKRCSTAS